MMKERVETQKLDGGGNDQEGSNKHKRKNKRKLFLSLGRQFRKDLSQFTQFSLVFSTERVTHKAARHYDYFHASAFFPDAFVCVRLATKAVLADKTLAHTKVSQSRDEKKGGLLQRRTLFIAFC